MIFVTVGTQLPFDRIVRAVDGWMLEHPGQNGFAQIGHSAFRPMALSWRESLGHREYEIMFRAADVIVAHAGIGSLLSAIRHRKRLLLVPRSAALGEHRNDHQRETAARIRQNGWAEVVEDERELVARLNHVAAIPIARSGSEDRLPGLIAELRGWIHDC